jgi:hypothetical protein
MAKLNGALAAVLYLHGLCPINARLVEHKVTLRPRPPVAIEA